MATKHIVWSNRNLNLKDWKDDLLEEMPNASDDELYQEMIRINDEYLEDERCNLNIDLWRPIVVIADLGLWDGRKSAYKIIQSGNIRDCLSANGDYVEWYVDGYKDLRCIDSHHDGTNYYLYRVVKHDISDTTLNNFLNKIYNGTVTKADISRVTERVGDEICRVYGW